MVIHFLDVLKEVYHFTKATFYAFIPVLKSTLRKSAKKNESKYFNSVTYIDRSNGEERKYLAIAQEGMLCNQIVFDTIGE